MTFLTRIFLFVRKHRGAFFIFALALLARLIVFYVAVRVQGGLNEHFWADGYYEIAVNLMKHGAFSRSMLPPFEPDSIRTPGLPFLLYPFLFLGNGVFIFLLAQMIVGSALPLIGRRLALLSGLNRGFAGAVGVLMAVDPFAVGVSTRILSETFFTLCFLLFVLYFLRAQARESIGAAALWNAILPAALWAGLATLFRPTTFYVPIVAVAAWYLFARTASRRLITRPAIIFLLLSYALALPWLYRNYNQFGTIGYSSVKEEVLYSALAPSVLAVVDNKTYDDAQTDFFARAGLPHFPDIMLDEASRFRKQALGVVAAHPWAFIRVALINQFTFFTHDGLLDLLGLLGEGSVARSFGHDPSAYLSPAYLGPALEKIIRTPAAMGIAVARLLWTGIAASFFVASGYQIIRKKMTASTGFLLLFILYFALTTIANGFAVNARFRYPVNGLIFIVALRGLQTLLESRRGSAQGQTVDSNE